MEAERGFDDMPTRFFTVKFINFEARERSAAEICEDATVSKIRTLLF